MTKFTTDRAALDEIERLRGLTWIAWREFNAIRARSGAPLAHDGMTTSDESWWSQMTDMFAEAIGPDARKPWPSPDAKRVFGHVEEINRLRAENERLRDALEPFATLNNAEANKCVYITDAFNGLTTVDFRRARAALSVTDDTQAALPVTDDGGIKHKEGGA